MITRRRMLAASGGLAAMAAAKPAAAETPIQAVPVEQWKSNEAVRSLRAKDQQSISPVRSASTRSLRRPNQHVFVAQASLSSRGRVRHGIRIP